MSTQSRQIEETSKSPGDADGGLLSMLDTWMKRSPWHPRAAPFILYVLLLAVMEIDELFSALAAGAAGVLHTVLQQTADVLSHPAAHLTLYILQCGTVAWLLWRYRRLTPELTLRFHWLAGVTGVVLAAAWVALGMWAVELWPSLAEGARDAHELSVLRGQSPRWFMATAGLRLLGMMLLVPIFEELFVRSLCLRSFHSARQTGVGLLQLAHDLPVIGDVCMHLSACRRAAAQPAAFTHQFLHTPLGALSVFGVTASTLVFMLSHVPRDWAGCIVCGVVWCVLLWWTNRGGGRGEGGRPRLGLGPVIWSHAITNALLWSYSAASGDWQFL